MAKLFRCLFGTMHKNNDHLKRGRTMISTTYANARINFGHYCDVACQDRKPVLITREHGGDVVLISEKKWESIQETLFIAGDPEMMAGIRKSEEDLAAGRVHTYDSVAELHAKALANIEA